MKQGKKLKIPLSTLAIYTSVGMDTFNNYIEFIG